MNHVMIDIETMGTGHYAAILSIGAIVFDPIEGERAEKALNSIVKLSDAVDCGLKIEPATLIWWMKQSSDAKDEWLDTENVRTLSEALTDLSMYIHSTTDTGGRGIKVWANAPTFDCALLRDAYEVTNLACPWVYYNELCFRTIKEIARTQKVKAPKREGTKHSAADDACYQAECVSHWYEELGYNGTE